MYIYRVTAFNSITESKVNPVDSARTLSTGINDDPEVPAEFRVYQNYPNPFNPETVIEYYLPLRSNVEIKISSVTGEIISQNIIQGVEAGGHQFKWNGGANPSGIYFCSVTARGENDENKLSRVIKMILMK